MTTGQGHHRSLGNPTSPTLHARSFGVVSINVQGSTKPWDTPVRLQEFDGYNSDDSWKRYQTNTESKVKKYEAFCRAFQARKDQQMKQQQQQEKEIKSVAKY